MNPSCFTRPGRRAALLVCVCVTPLFACSSDDTTPIIDAAAPLDGTGESALQDAQPGSDASTTSPHDGAIEVDGTIADAGLADATRGDASSDGSATCPDAGVPDDLACTGLYSDWASKTVAANVLPYTPGLVFWSDGAQKQRWIYLPPGTQIDTTDMDDWVFPIGTKIWKSFTLNNALIETRLIWKQPDMTWDYAVYRWSADGTSATQITGGEKNVNGTTYEIPATSACTQCHGGRADVVLGIDLLGIGVPAAEGVTLASLADAGRFTTPPPATTVVIPDDSTQKAAAALGWLHVNCGVSCHNGEPNAVAFETHLYTKLLAAQLYPHGTADAGLGTVADLDPYTSEVGVPASLTPGGVQYLRIAPGDATHSLTVLTSITRGGDGGIPQMPTLVSHIPDDAGVTELEAWINALPRDAGGQ
jgi:hypothetical protein